MRRATIAAALAAGVALLTSPVAVGAPTGVSANETISRLQAQGNRVVVNKVGTGAMADCTVTSVRASQVPAQPRGGPRLGGLPAFTPPVTVMHVGLQC